MTRRNSFRASSGAAAAAVAELQERLGSFPEDYLAFLAESDGGDGPVGAEGYVVLWPVDELVRANRGYSVKEFLADTVLIGSDGGGEGFGFRRRSDGSFVYISVPLGSLFEDDIVEHGPRFEGLLCAIALGVA